MMIKQNVGLLDRITRTFLGGLLVAVKLVFQYGGWVGTLLLGVGLLWIVEGVLGYCLLYGVFGWSTQPRRVR